MYKNTYKIIFLLSVFLISVSLIFCKKKEINTKDLIDKTETSEIVQTPIDSSRIMEALTAPGRYWILESIAIKKADSEKEISEDTAYFDRTEIWRIHAYAYQFGNSNQSSPTRFIAAYTQVKPADAFEGGDYSKGLYGKRPYGVAELALYVAFPQVNKSHTWQWNESDVSLQLDPSVFLSDRFSKKAFLDTGKLPLYKSASEARNAGKPEIIRFISEIDDKKIGTTTLYYYLRSAWIIESKGDLNNRYAPNYLVLY
ncbi:hypothetical protein [Salmonirosea aquatica]|uniref:Uncharacterized protein n=1 Tax=Salmonirosea aquatica TaxID=2654236 RepID=A0A7C9FPI7_9BACT|nr:hypothetical protein [Cytophagaceae bacterium SJW1-29]